LRFHPSPLLEQKDSPPCPKFLPAAQGVEPKSPIGQQSSRGVGHCLLARLPPDTRLVARALDAVKSPRGLLPNRHAAANYNYNWLSRSEAAPPRATRGSGKPLLRLLARAPPHWNRDPGRASRSPRAPSAHSITTSSEALRRARSCPTQRPTGPGLRARRHPAVARSHRPRPLSP